MDSPLFWPKIRTKLALFDLLQNFLADFYGPQEHISEIKSAKNAPGKNFVSQGQRYMDTPVILAQNPDKIGVVRFA